MNEKADLVFKSDCIFTALNELPFSGYVAVKADRICAVAEGSPDEELIGNDTKIIELGNRTLTPGFSDVHCFFSGYVIDFLGKDLCECGSSRQAIEVLKSCKKEGPVFGHGLRITIAKEDLDAAFPDRPVVAFMKGCESCSMNEAAIKKFGFTPETCYPEAYVGIFPYVLSDKSLIVPQFVGYMKMMNSKGVTSIKEMGFDDYYGFTDALEELERNDQLTLRVNFMSQPVAKDMDLDYGERMRERFNGDKVTFSGYNQMTDGSVSQYCADLKRPYENTDFCCRQDISWEKLASDTRKADERGFRFSLHAQGDAAIAKVLDIYETCKKDDSGKMVNRQAITDLEFSDPKDLERMGRMGVVAEIYPQIQSIANRKDKIAMINEKIGEERGKLYWNRRRMADSGVIISCGTDLPLLIDDIPQSVYHAVGGFFPEGGEPFNPENTLTLSELLIAWTRGGAYDLCKEDQLGTIEVNKKADLAILDGNLFETSMEDIRDLKVCMTVCDGKIVYKGE